MTTRWEMIECNGMDVSTPLLVFYGIRNKEGKWYRSKGYGGHGDTWVDDIKKAKVWSKISPARAQITFFANKWPEYGIPDLIQLNVNNISVIDEKDRVTKAIQKKKEEEFQSQIIRLNMEMEYSREKKIEAERKIEALREKLQQESAKIGMKIGI
jgi:hypothetical protein